MSESWSLHPDLWANLAAIYLRTVEDRFAVMVAAPEVVTVRVPVPSFSSRSVHVSVLVPFGTPERGCVALEPL